MSQETVDIVVKESGSQEAATDISKVGDSAEKSSSQVDTLNSVMQTFTNTLAALGISLALKDMLSLNDTYTTMVTTLGEVSASTAELQKTQAALYETSQSTGQSLSALVDVYAGLSAATSNFGLSSTDLTGIVNTMSEAMSLSGKDMGTINAALAKLSDGMATGTISGRDLANTLKQFPQLAVAVANGMGTSVAGLQQMLQKGTVSTQQFTQALLQSADRVQAAYDEAATSVGQALGKIQNAFLMTAGNSKILSAANDLLIKGLDFVAAHMDVIFPIVSALGTGLVVLAGYLALTSTAAAGLWATLTANPIGLLVAAVATAISLIAAFGDKLVIAHDAAGNAVTALDVLTAAYNYIVAAVQRVVAIGKNLFDWLVQHNVFMYLAGAAVAYLTEKFAALVLSQVVSWFTSAAGGAFSLAGEMLKLVAYIGLATIAVGALAVALLPVAAIAAGLTAEFILVKAATIAMTDSVDAANKYLFDMKTKAEGIIDTLSHPLQSALSLATGGFAGLAKGETDTASASNSLSNSLKDLFAGIVSGSQTAGAAAKKAMTDTTDSIDDAIKAYDTWHAAVIKYGEDQTRELQQIADAANKAASVITDAMGRVVTAADAADTEAINTGKYFNGMAQAASSAASEIVQANDAIVSSSHAAADAMTWKASFTGGGGAGQDTSTDEYKVNPVTGYLNQVQAGSVFKSFVNPLNGYTNYEWVAPGGSTASSAAPVAPSGGGGGASVGFAYGGAFDIGGTGGTDSQLVQFMATPGETVSVMTPQQQRQARTGGAAPNITVQMTVVTPDVNSFQRSSSQILTNLQAKLNTVAGRMAGSIT